MIVANSKGVTAQTFNLSSLSDKQIFSHLLRDTPDGIDCTVAICLHGDGLDKVLKDKVMTQLLVER